MFKSLLAIFAILWFGTVKSQEIDLGLTGGLLHGPGRIKEANATITSSNTGFFSVCIQGLRRAKK